MYRSVTRIINPIVTWGAGPGRTKQMTTKTKQNKNHGKTKRRCHGMNIGMRCVYMRCYKMMRMEEERVACRFML